jgi:hypothetical protein
MLTLSNMAVPLGLCMDCQSQSRSTSICEEQLPLPA